MKILMADDSEVTRDLMRTFLQEMGHQVVGEAENGREAVKIFTELKPDLMLLDLVMPGKTGLEALQEIRAIDPAARVIMVTAVQQDGINQELLAKGAIAILSKPFSYPEFAEVLKRFA
jgi:two-component system, chemotaxis family, chemotaxis protein CheY